MKPTIDAMTARSVYFAQMGGAEIKGWMQRCGLSYRTASHRLGVHKRTVIRYAQGHTQVPRTVELLCRAIEEELAMSYSKTIPMHKRIASGEPVTGMKNGGECKGYKSGGAVKAVHKHEKNMHPGKPLTPLKKGGKSC